MEVFTTAVALVVQEHRVKEMMEGPVAGPMTALVVAGVALGLLVSQRQALRRALVVRGLVPRLRAARLLGRVAAVAVTGMQQGALAVAGAVALVVLQVSAGQMQQPTQDQAAALLAIWGPLLATADQESLS